MINMNENKHVHCIGIGGIGLSAIAEILLARGHEVSGSDMNEGDKTKSLHKDGATIYIGHNAENIKGADIVVYSAAIRDDNPELYAAREQGIPTYTRAEMLGELMSDANISIAVAGTHGKTTTTSMISLVLLAEGVNPTLLVGGNLSQIHGNVKVGKNDYFVTEACEYMDSFLSLKPKIEVILNIDSDHLDYFKDIDHIVESFTKFTSLVPDDGYVLAYSANPFVSRATKGMKNVITFGLNEGCDFYALKVDFNEGGHPSYDFYHDGEFISRVQLSVPGEYNLLNSLAALSTAYVLKVNMKKAISTLEKFTGTQRRFDIQGVTSTGVIIIDDYAHHPTEIKATLSAVKNMKHKKVWCLFQPHTYTRTIALFDEFTKAFVDADEIVFAEIYAAREKNVNNISSKELANQVKKNFPKKGVSFIESFHDITEYVYVNAAKGDIVLTMGAGDIYKIGEEILEKDKKYEKYQL